VASISRSEHKLVRRLHIGGRIRTPGWEVLDAIPGPHVDHVGNAKDLRLFADGTFAEVYAAHVLEHFDYKDEIPPTLKEWHRVLEPGGLLHVSVPDLNVLARLFCDRQRLSPEDRFAVMRMIFGGHMDRYDYHLVGLYDELLVFFLGSAGFATVKPVADFGLFEDSSSFTVHGVKISLNVTAFKPLTRSNT
jgi:predicted SAM-dependent methyltransferase